MMKRLLASTICLGFAASLLAAPGFAQTPATPAPATPAPAAAAPGAPAAAPVAPVKPATAASATAPKRTPAERSDRVQKLQTALNANGAKLTVDGKMGAKTRAALTDFQKAHGLKTTGRPDKETRDALKMAS
jgi:peptidoglycan hydrolase-like protein with peptidoglycan-binding domain